VQTPVTSDETGDCVFFPDRLSLCLSVCPRVCRHFWLHVRYLSVTVAPL